MDDHYIVVGFSNSSDGDVSYNYGGADYWIIKINSDGNLIWEKALGGTKSDVAYSAHNNLIDEGIIVAGFSMSTDGDVSDNHGWSDCWIVKLSFND